jgi:hypothetical protein
MRHQDIFNTPLIQEVPVMKEPAPSFVFPEDGGNWFLQNLGMLFTKLGSIASQKTLR